MTSDMLAAIRTHKADSFKHELREFLASFGDPALLSFSSTHYCFNDGAPTFNDVVEAFARHRERMVPPIATAIDLAINLPGPTDSQLLEIVDTLGRIAACFFDCAEDHTLFDDAFLRSVHIDRALCFCDMSCWAADITWYLEFFSLQGQVEALASFIGKRGACGVSLDYVEGLSMQTWERLPLPDLTRRYLATFPRCELEEGREDFYGRLEELVLRGLMLATGCKRINWETRATNIRLWLMLAAAKLKLLAIRARKRTWKPGSAAVVRLAAIYGSGPMRAW